MNIHSFYRKITGKSRTFFAGVFSAGRRVDIFLLAAALALFALAAVRQVSGKPAVPKRAEIFISAQCESLFGRDAVNTLVQEFEELNPDLRILAAGPDGRGADILFFDESGYGGFLLSGELAPLTPYIHSESPAERSAIRLVSYMDLFFYNIDILEAADCDRPPKTRAEFIAAARAVAKNASGSPGREAVFPLALGLKAEDPLALRRDIYPWIWAGAGDSSGWKPLSDDGTLSRSALETAAFFGQLNGEGLLAPGTFEKTGAERLEEFASGKTAMMTASAEDIAYLRQSAQGLNFGVTAVPAAASPGKNRVGLSGIYAGISSGCALPDEAWAFLAFIAGRSRFLVEALLAVPGSFPGAFPGAFIADDPLYSKAWDIFEAADVVEYGAAGEEADGLIRESLLAAFAK